MALQIEDGKGRGGLAGVTENRLDSSARTNSRIAYVSRDNEDAYTWSHSYDHDAADTVLLVSNSSTAKQLRIHAIFIGANLATEWTVHSPAYPTLAGSVVTGVNTNRTSGKVAEAEAYGDETGNTQANILANGLVTDNGTVTINPDGSIILGYHDCIAIDLVNAGTTATATIAGYYE